MATLKTAVSGLLCINRYLRNNDAKDTLSICLQFSLLYLMTSSNGHIVRVTDPLCGEINGHRWIPLTKASDADFDVFFDLCLNKQLSKQSWGWWFETPSRSLWHHYNEIIGKQYYAPNCGHVTPCEYNCFFRIRWWFPDHLVSMTSQIVWTFCRLFLNY